MLSVKITVTDSATPALAAVGDSLKDRRGLNKSIAGSVEDITRAHIRIAAQTRHTTATRLGAAPTNYLSKLSETIESHSDGVGVVMDVYGAIFRRVTGAVDVRPVTKKWLTIPAAAESYGRRAGEFSDLEFALNKGGESARLINSAGKVLFWLKKQVTLPQDRGLLPSDEQFTQAAELGARNFLEQQIAAARGNGFTPPGGYSRS